MGKFTTAIARTALVRLGRAQPGLKLELVSLPRQFSLTKREADMAVSLARPSKGRLHAHKLTNYELGLYGSKAYLAEAGRPETLADLRHHGILGYIQDLIYARELDYIPQISRDISPRLTSSSLPAQLNMTLAGGGLCVLPRFLAHGHADLVHVLPEEVRLVRSFWLVVHSELRGLSRIRACADFLTEEVRAAGALFHY